MPRWSTMEFPSRQVARLTIIFWRSFPPASAARSYLHPAHQTSKNVSGPLFKARSKSSRCIRAVTARPTIHPADFYPAGFCFLTNLHMPDKKTVISDKMRRLRKHIEWYNEQIYEIYSEPIRDEYEKKFPSNVIDPDCVCPGGMSGTPQRRRNLRRLTFQRAAGALDQRQAAGRLVAKQGGTSTTPSIIVTDDWEGYQKTNTRPSASSSCP